MGNSIEEDIAKVNTYIELVLEKDYCNCNELNTILGKHCDGSKNVAYAMQHILSDYKRVLKENEGLKIKNNTIKRESEAYAENMIRLDNELNLEKEKSKYEWIRQNCLPQELVNKLYIPIQKVKDKIEELKQERDETYTKFLGGNRTDENLSTRGKMIEGGIKVLQELLEESEE